MNLGGPELLLVLAVVLLLFGSTQLPKLARSLGQAKKEFERGGHEHDDESAESRRSASAPKDRDEPIA